MIPTNEQGVVALFSKLADEMGYKFKEIGTHCPDVILEKDKRIIRGEFEYKAKTFRAHKHNPDDVDMIICWEDDWPDAPVPVLCLETYVTLTRQHPRKSWFQRLIDSWVNLRQYWNQRGHICPVCGHLLNVWCSDEYDGIHIHLKCSKCKYYDGGRYL